MSLVHRVGMVVTIALVVTSGRIPTARAMTLPDLHGRQETAVAVSAAATSAVSASIDPAVSISSAAISSSINPSSAPPPTSSAVASAAPTTASVVPTSSVASLAVTTSSAAPLSTDPSLSASITATSPSISASISSALNATSTSTANQTLAEELESPLPKPNYAPGGMAFILPAFVVIGLIFIIWLIHKTKEYIWKLKEAEEAADTQSPNPGSGPLGAVSAPAPKVGGAEKPAGSGMGGKWKKKGWKELDSDSEGEHVYRRTSDKYSRVGEWQGSRKYRSRDGRHARDREDGHREGGERGRYGRLDAHDDERHYGGPVERRSSHREERRRESDHARDRPRSRADGARPHSPAPSHVSRALSKKEKKERAAEWINDERHHVSERRDSGGHDHRRGGGGKGKEREREAYEEYERGHATGQHFSLMPPQEGQRKVEPQLEVQIGASAVASPPPAPVQPLQRTKTQRKPAAPAPAPAPETPTHEDVPAYMRARAVSPPPILSPPLHPNLFFHNGPSMTQLVPLSTYDSGTDLESMISAQPSPMPNAGDTGRMPDVPSTAEKLERSATSGPGRTTRKAQTPTNSRLVARTPTRTKSHDPSAPAPGTPSAAGGRADVLRTPTRRGTDGVKATGRATPTIRLIESRGGSIRGGQTPDLSKASGLTPKKYSRRVAPAPTPSSTPESIRRVRAQKKELKARGKVDEILRDSWSERAVVSPAGPGAEEDEDDEEEVEVDVVEKEERRVEGKVPRDEVEMAHSKARAMSPPPASQPASGPAAPVASSSPIKQPLRDTRPTSPLRVKPIGGVIPGVESADLLRLQGIDQRMALMKQLEERMKR